MTPLLCLVLVLASLVSVPLSSATSVIGGPIDEGVAYKYPLFRSWHDVFPDELIDALIKDANELERTAGDNFKFGKRGTNWYPMSAGKSHKPRFAAEVAIHMLKELDFAGNAFEEQGIVGAEWWFQVRDKTDNIGFHYDKDEATASEEMRLVLPSISTVSYLTNVGAPTLIFNQTSIDGNDDEPAVPVQGGLVFPQRNKHILFRGNLMHGVSGSLGAMHAKNVQAQLGDQSTTRVTFLVNWWAYTPAPPNCIPPDAAMVKLLRKSSGATTKLSQPTSAVEHAFEPLPLEGELVDVVVEIPALERLHVPFPVGMATPNSYSLDWSLGTSTPVLRGVTLDLFDTRSTNQVFSSSQPKAIAFYAGLGDAKRNEVDHVFLKAVRPFDGQLLPFVGELSKVKEALAFFGVSEAQLPIVVVHDTVNELRYRMDGDAEFVEEDIVEFLRNVLDGSVSPLQNGHDEL